ncbi:ogr/Delta-like zinc finger family protein [Candidatus Harpocratesius sp.]
MVGRPKKDYSIINSPILIETGIYTSEVLTNVPAICPNCHLTMVGTYSTHKRKKTRIEYFQCKNLDCSHLKDHTSARQFSFTSSWAFINSLNGILKKMTSEIMLGKISQSAIAEKSGVSNALVSFIRTKIEKTLDLLYGLDQLVQEPTDDTAIAGDETFIKINGVSYYILMFTGYTTHKILGIKVSKSRKEKDIRNIFDEAERNTKYPISIITADTWGPMQVMAKNLNKPITLVIHKHKKPYDKAVIWKIEYDKNYRKITKIGIKCDFFKKRAKKEYFYIKTKENIVPQSPKKRGRPKDAKNKQQKKKQKKKQKNTKGRKGIFAPFNRGKQGYAKINPYQKKIQLAKNVSPAVAAALGEIKDLFWRKSISNNLAENKNSVIQAHINLTGPKSPEDLEKRLRSFIIIHNSPEILDLLMVPHKFRPKIMYNGWYNSEFRRFFDIIFKLGRYKKVGVSVN